MVFKFFIFNKIIYRSSFNKIIFDFEDIFIIQVVINFFWLTFPKFDYNYNL